MSVEDQLNRWAMLRDVLNEPYGFRLLQDSLAIFNTLKVNQLTPADLHWFVEETKLLLTSGTYQSKISNAIQNSYTIHKDLNLVHSCPKCDTPCYEFAVNTSACDQVGGGYKSQWICPKCDTEEFE